MTKKSKIALVTGLLLIGVLTLFLLQPEPSGDSDASPEPPAPTYSVYAAPSPPARIHIRNTVSTYSIEAAGEEGAYRVAEFDASVPLNATLLSSVGRNAASLTATLMIEPQEPLSSYGLEHPVEVVLDFGDSKTTLYLGGLAPDGSTVYLQASGDYLAETGRVVIYGVSLESVKSYFLGALDFIHPTISQISMSGVLFDTALFSGALRSEPIALERVPPASDELPSAYRLTAPVRRDVDPSGGLLALRSLMGIIASDAVAVHPDEETLRRYGLETPYSTVRLTGTEEGDFTLSASEQDGAGRVYLIREGVPVIYSLSASSLGWLSLDVDSLMDKTILNPTLGEISSLMLETPAASYTLGLAGGEDSLTVTLGGEPLDTGRFHAFFQALTAGALTGYTATEAGEGDAFLLRITCGYRDGSPAEVITFYPGPAREAYVSFGEGPAAFRTSSTYVDRVLAELKALA